MSLVLIGPPAAGKSRIGRRIAPMLGLPFVDTDALITAQHGPIADIFGVHGEPHFRAIEREVVAAALGRDGVVSLGGGAVLDTATQRQLVDHHVVLVTISSAAAAKRIVGNTKRPLIDGIESWIRLVEQRSQLYASLADVTVDTSDRKISVIVDEIATWARDQGISKASTADHREGNAR